MAASSATVSASLPRTLLPSDSSTIAAGAVASCPGTFDVWISRSALWRASPVAVLPAAVTPRSADATASWSRVGLASTVGSWLKAIAPMRTSFGTASTNFSAALRAATRRLGATSLASIEPERSVATTTVACSTATARVVSGRATATISAASASA